jgi:hypothetical protein
MSKRKNVSPSRVVEPADHAAREEWTQNIVCSNVLPKLALIIQLSDAEFLVGHHGDPADRDTFSPR